MMRFFYIFYFLVLPAAAQQIKFENFSTHHGLSNNSVMDIENDEDGGIWIATWDGLNYYDGTTFTIFKHNITNSQTISSDYITKLEKDMAKLFLGYICLYLLFEMMH